MTAVEKVFVAKKTSLVSAVTATREQPAWFDWAEEKEAEDEWALANAAFGKRPLNFPGSFQYAHSSVGQWHQSGTPVSQPPPQHDIRAM